MPPPRNSYGSSIDSRYIQRFGGQRTGDPTTEVELVRWRPEPTCSMHVIYRIVSFTPSGEFTGLWYRSAAVNVSSGTPSIRSETDIHVWTGDVGGTFLTRFDADARDLFITAIGVSDPATEWLVDVDIVRLPIAR